MWILPGSTRHCLSRMLAWLALDGPESPHAGWQSLWVYSVVPSLARSPGPDWATTPLPDARQRIPSQPYKVFCAHQPLWNLTDSSSPGHASLAICLWQSLPLHHHHTLTFKAQEAKYLPSSAWHGSDREWETQAGIWF